MQKILLVDRGFNLFMLSQTAGSLRADKGVYYGTNHGSNNLRPFYLNERFPKSGVKSYL